MRRLLLPFLAFALLACGSHGNDPPISACAGSAMPLRIGVTGSVSGTFASDLLGDAAAYQQGNATSGFTVLDGFVFDDQFRPTGELFLFLRSPAKVSEVRLIPVTLDQLNDESFVPSGSFAVFATAYDAVAKDYTKWLLGTSGCLAIRSAAGSAVGMISARVVMEGQWQSSTGASLGAGSVTASVTAPLVDFRTGVMGVTDAMAATVTGVRAKPFATATLDAYQVLHPAQTRLLVVGTQPADSTREIWLSLAGVPRALSDTIRLGTPTLAEARAGRTTTAASFGMMRLLDLDNVGQPIVRELWRSTSGWVKLNPVVQNGPLALCGYVGGSFSMTTQGTSLTAPATDLGVTTVTGTFTTRMTVLAPSDTLTDAAKLPPSPSRLTLRAPVAQSGLACP